MKPIYYLTVLHTRCLCGNVLTVRTKERLHTEPCWRCGKHTIKVVLGYGERNLRVAVIDNATQKETTMKYWDLVQKRPEE